MISDHNGETRRVISRIRWLEESRLLTESLIFCSTGPMHTERALIALSWLSIRLVGLRIFVEST